jgi:phosphoribosylformylglycinamidine cyclo-ligase
VFQWLQKEGAVADSEMWRTFNCGIGFVLIVAADQLETVSAAVKAEGLEHWTIGQVVTAQGGERVHIA